ncbi:MAG: amino acid adenylation domain-containing protein, partial [Lachnospiraceae bacterium]|nr:amino acid adenylation domain-containing protein [Lachnospiraceae bacterium]
MSTINDKLSQLSPEKQALLEKLLRKKRLRQTQGGAVEIKPAQVDNNRYPLTFAQEKIWVANHISLDATMYNMISIARIRGIHRILEAAQMQRFVEGLQEMFHRHEILHMHFKEENGLIYAEMDEDMVFEPEMHDYSHLNRDRKAVVAEMMDEVAGKPFDLEKDTLVRASLICTAPNDWTVMLVMHHLVGDGMSINIALGEALQYCFAKVGNIENRQQELSIQFKDFAWWERNAKKDIYEEKLAKKYWVDQLEGADFSLDILKEMQDLTHFDALALREEIHISAQVAKKIQDVAQREQVTVFSIYFAVLKLLIYKYSMQKDITAGVITLGRDLAELQPMVGCFADILPIRSVIDDNLTFSDFIKASYENFLESYEKKDAYLKKEESPIYQLLFNYKEHAESKLVFDGLEIDFQEIDNGYSRAAMDFELIKAGDKIEGGINYRKGVFDETFIQQFVERYYLLLDEIIHEASGILDQKINEIEVLTKAERKKIQIDFNKTKMVYPKEKTVVHLFEEQVAKATNDIAMTFEDTSMTYGALNAKANVLAKRLRDMGIKPGDYVAMKTERSFELVIGIYGIIKSGAAYVPIDVTCPKERLAYMLEDCDAKAILLYQADVSREDVSIPVINLADQSIYEGEESNLPIVNTPEDDFYLIYTSGTTGEPKGVMCRHKGTVNLIAYLQKNYPIDKSSIVLQKTAYTFDASIVEIFRWSLTGARGHLLSPGDEKDPFRMCEEIGVHHVTEMQVVPSMLKVMMIAVKNDEKKYGHMLKTLRYVFTGGEAITVDVVNDFYKVFGQYSKAIALINTYGPTETSVEAAHYHLKANEEKVLIGKPIGNYQAYILNGTTLCGIDMIGELCIAGVGVTKGYLNSEALTNEKFIVNPFGDGKLYRTGDGARWLVDGNMEYLGRVDEQVKIRGFRIELGEIESALRSIPTVLDAVVIVVTNESGDKTLCAYVQSENELDFEQIKLELRNHLPEYMVPAYFMRVEEIPVTSSGKLNKKALPKIEISSTQAYVAPITETEKTMVHIFQEMFDIEQVGINDSFFELGGNSLKATLLVNRIEQETGLRLGIKDIFQGVTVAGICLALEDVSGVYEPIPQAEEKEYYPMSSAQKRLFVLDQLEDASIVYNMPIALKMEGKLDVDKAEAMFHQLIERHEAFRTSFELIDGEAVQIIHKNVVSDVVYKEQGEVIDKKQVMEEFIRPFDLSQAPLIRAEIVKVEEEGHVLLLDMHHIISDGISTVVLMSEFLALYAGAELPALRVQYKDYTQWMLSRDLSAQKAYWLGQFEDEIPVLALPIDYARPTLQSFKGATLVRKLDKRLRDCVLRLSAKTNTTEYMVLLSLFMMMLGKYGNQEDVVVGTPISGRTHRDTENMLGIFVNTLVMRGKPNKDKTLSQFLEEVKAFSLGAYENQEYPFEELVEVLDLPRDMSRNPLFDVMFSLDENNEQESKTIHGVKFDSIEGEHMDAISKFDLSLSLREMDGGYEAAFEYCMDLFREETISRMAERFIYLLEQIDAYSEAKIGEIEIVLEAEKNQILTDFNKTAMVYPKDKTVIELFEDQVQKAPDHVAMMFENQSMTYGVLNAKANVIARRLRDMGIKPGDYVAMKTERSFELVIGIYGIIKSGAAYVPIDVACPKERLQYMLKDCDAKAILLYQADVSMEDFNIPIMHLADESIYGGDESNLPIINTPEDDFYLIYTSGTTGEPKGVMCQHKGTVNLITYLQENYFIDASSTVLQKTAYTFDASIVEIFRWSLTGAKGYLLSPEDEKDPFRMCEEIGAHQITEMQVVPSMLKTMMIAVKSNKAKYAHMLKTLRYVFTGGEAITVDGVNDFYEMFSDYNSEVDLINTYGPTETSIEVTHHHLRANEKVVIGTPVGNDQAYIVNGIAICGIGMIGELCIAGVGVTKGYLNSEALTNEKFIENPFGDGKLYRTGDAARWQADGNIEYLGRIDEQVKIRGFRIELGEIESALRNIEAVLDAVAIVQENETGDKTLCAYVQSEISLDFEQIKAQLRNHLPEYMVPAYFMQIDEIPVTSSGKQNKRALPKIAITAIKAYVAPSNETEKAIAAIFEEMFGIEQVGIKESFFELGGNSLKATLLVNHIEQVTGVRLGIKDIFQGLTVEGISLALEDVEGTYEPIPQAEVKTYYPMSSSQKRLYLIEQISDVGVSYNLPIPLKVQGKLKVEDLESVFQKLVQRHEAFRTSFHLVDGEPVQQIHSHVKMNIGYKEQDKGLCMEQMIRDFICPFDLSQAPLMRVDIVKKEEDSHMLLIDMHHIISDGMSISLFIEELLALAAGACLPELRVQYKDYSEWMRSRDLSSQKDYWIDAFSDEIPVLELPIDYARPAIQSFAGATIVIETGKELGSKIKELARKTGTTEYMVFLASAMTLLGAYANQEDVVIGSPISGRTHRDTENMFGMFVGTLAMRGYPEKEKSFVRLLEEIKTTSLKAYENQEYPIEELIENVAVRRDMSRNPLFDVMLILQNNEDPDFRDAIEGLSIEFVEAKNAEAKFDLTFIMEEQDESFEIALEYCTMLFQQETVELMLAHYIELLSDLVEKPEMKLKEIDMLTEIERGLIFGAFNDTAMEYPSHQTVVQLFEEQVAKAPDNIAMTFEGTSMTYGVLNCKANVIAKRLRDMGVVPGDYVAMKTERSLELVIGIYGIIKSGAAYVPVDVACPKGRLRYMLDDCAAKAMLVYQVDVDMEDIDIPIIDLADVSVYKGEGINLPIVNTVEDDFYLIYTSGTTGEPKGVMCQHKGTVNLISYLQKNYPIDENSTVLQKTAYTFDASIVEIFRWSLTGAQGYLLSPGDERDPFRICEEIAAHHVTEMQVVPSMLKTMMIAVKSDEKKYGHMLAGLCYVFTGGEAITIDVVNDFYQLLGGYNQSVALINTYGPTETSVEATHYHLKANEEKVLIGKPVGNYQAYILNGITPCGIGMVGELCIAGVGVTKGYLNSDTLTNEKFVDNPFGDGKLYRTGDAARWLSDGNMECLGRMDEQVKIRGFRIELGEVESALRSISTVLDAVAVVVANESGDKTLCAYVQSEDAPDFEQMKLELRNHLPEYMVPTYFMGIKEIPVTSNGKLNKRALPKIEILSTREYVAPTTETEIAMVTIFEEMFDVKQVGINDSFFELGGNSLKATLLVNRVEQATGVRIGIKDIFQRVTVAGICSAVAEGGGIYEPIPKAEEKEYYPMSSAQKRLFVLNQIEDAGIAYNMPFTMRVAGELDVDKAERAFAELTRRHEALRTSFGLAGAEPVQYIHKEVTANVVYQDEEGIDVNQVMEDFIRPFDLSKAPLIRVEIVKVEADNHILFLDMHHIVSDGLSIEVLMSDFLSLYTGVELPALRVQYKDYSQWMLSRDLGAQKAFWLNQFEEEIPALELPIDYVRPSIQSFAGATVAKSLGMDLRDKVVKLATRTGSTEYMILLSLFMLMLGKYGNQEDVVVG